ncbi:MAG: phospholipid carrier-dependent glycosyltransferase [Candidatus Binatus sp.]|uniref:glycosyltransferase family 39 protein n=1 Tax=Candidatus Binatus sp. TaxID=2811406 RepID=UPI00271779B7|nr:glycosyltransferase family 39 protein [Candidatus Binatus sp.]MDO8433495.1 phospholipid carrier-dependent glycosyltransferase [Candidatus Binatus sp.]
MLANSRRNRLILCALVAAALYLPGLGAPALWEPDEGRYAEIAREMVASRDYVTPRNNFELYFEKPPLVYWCDAAMIDLFGPTEFAVRLPSALFSIGQVVVTAALADAMLGASAGLLSALALMLMPLFFAFARFATLDPALAFFLTAALASFYRASRGGSFGNRTSRFWMIVSAAMLALGTLAKGPVAPILGVAIILLWLAAAHRLREIAAMPLIWCAALYLAIAMPWFVIAEARNPGFLRFFFIHEHLQRYVSSREHGWGPWFFIPIVLAGCWPWIFFAPLGWSAMRTPRAASDQGSATLLRSDARFLLIWFIVIFVFFSIPRSKLGTYILPALPPLAIFAGCGLARLSSLADEHRIRVLKYCAIANAAIATIAAVALAVALHPTHPALAQTGILVAVAIALGAASMYALGRAGNRINFGIGALAIAMALTIALAEKARDDAASLSTYRNLAHAVEPYLGAAGSECALASYRHYVQSLPFYTHRRETRVVYWGELSEVNLGSRVKSPFLIGSDARLGQVWGSGSCMVLIANARDLPALRGVLKPAPVVLGCEGKKYALYNGSLAPPPAASACVAQSGR